MAGASRYLWTHGIVPRKTDVISGEDGLTLSHRQTRVSFTFRTLRRAPCTCGKLGSPIQQLLNLYMSTSSNSTVPLSDFPFQYGYTDHSTCSEP